MFKNRKFNLLQIVKLFKERIHFGFSNWPNMKSVSVKAAPFLLFPSLNHQFLLPGWSFLLKCGQILNAIGKYLVFRYRQPKF